MKRNIIALNNENEDSSDESNFEFSKVSSIKDEESYENKLVFLFSVLDAHQTSDSASVRR